LESQVKDSRPDTDEGVIRRRRTCEKCGAKFNTVEAVHFRDLKVRKSDDTTESFDKEKIKKSIKIACIKRDITDEQIDVIANSLRRRLEMEAAEDVISSEIIGNMVSESLLELDPIAFVRFASVYRKFNRIGEFRKILSEVIEKDNKPTDTKFKDGNLF
jgi:transcriptional repressor NrdR